MAIQGTQVPMYTKHTLFLYFFNFSIFFLVFNIMKNKIKQNRKQTNKQKHVKTMHGIKLDGSKTRKHNTQVMHKQNEREREIVTK